MLEVPQGVPEIHVSGVFFPDFTKPCSVAVLGILPDNMGWGYDQQCLSELVSLFLFINFYIREGLGEAYDGDIAFASSLEMFGRGHNDPLSVAFGGQWCTSYFDIYIKIYLFSLIL
jgi:hypothetical protein